MAKDSCLARITAGVAVGGAVGGAVGAVYGTYEAIRIKDLMAIKPTKMCFPPSEYRKQIKIGTRCMLADAIKTLEGLNPKMSSTERRWFEEHPQFKHLFHMKSRKENHRVQAMWMLLLRTAETKKKKEVWFVVNGVPIRYGLREQALISGLDCQTYPLGYEDCGSMNFVKRHFKSGESIRLEDVKAKLVNMGPHRDRLKMAVLFFLGSVICGQTKTGKSAHDVLEFFQRAVDDLEFCKKFPWGRYSFDYMLKQIEHTMKHFVVREEDDLKIRQAPDNPQTLWPIPGFCIPLELLAFEAIPSLFQAFREPVQEAEKNCPLMCHSTFKKGSGLTGASLSELYKELGHETIIHSIIPTRTSMQEHMLDDLLEDEDDRDDDDIAVDSWDRRMLEDLPVRFEDMFAEDVALREKEAAQMEEEVGEEGEDTGAVMKMLKSVLRCMKKLEKKIDKKWDGIEEKVDGIEKKVEGIEKKVALLVRVDP